MKSVCHGKLNLHQSYIAACHLLDLLHYTALLCTTCSDNDNMLS